MSHYHYTELVKEFCEYCGLGEPERIAYGGAIMLGEVAFSLMHREEIDPELMFIYCDFGEVLEGREVEVYRALLEANLFLYNGRAPLFTISSETGRVTMAAHCRLDELKAETLLAIVKKMEAQAMAWRADPLLEAVA